MQYLAEPTAATFCPGSPKTFWQSCILDLGSGSKISALDPRRCFEHLGSWMLDPYNVRLEIFKSEPFSDLRFSSRRNRSKTKKQSMNFRQKHYLKKNVFVFCGFIDVLLQCIQDDQKTFLGSGPKIQDPRLSKNFSWIQGRNLGSKWDCWIQGFQHKFFKILDLGFVRPGIRSLTAVQTWDPKSEVPHAILKSNVIYVYVNVNVYVSVYVYL